MGALSEPAMTSDPFDSPLRCTRCGKIALPATVGRTPDGALVFGWCLACMAEVGCVGNDESVPLSIDPPAWVRSARASVRPPVSIEIARSRTAWMIALALIVWGMLLFSWFVALRIRPAEPPRTLHRVRYAPRIEMDPLVFGIAGGVIILIGLVQLFVAIRRPRRPSARSR